MRKRNTTMRVERRMRSCTPSDSSPLPRRLLLAVSAAAMTVMTVGVTAQDVGEFDSTPLWAPPSAEEATASATAADALTSGTEAAPMAMDSQACQSGGGLLDVIRISITNGLMGGRKLIAP